MNLQAYLENYESVHRNPINKACHAAGIPLIIMGIAGLLTSYWKPALASFSIGWVLQAIGHQIEGKKPAFFSNPIYLLIGPIWLMYRLFVPLKRKDP